jgi:hypothetical protein
MVGVEGNEVLVVVALGVYVTLHGGEELGGYEGWG